MGSLAREIAEARDAGRLRTMSPFERRLLDELGPCRALALDMRGPVVSPDPTRRKRKVRRS